MRFRLFNRLVERIMREEERELEEYGRLSEIKTRLDWYLYAIGVRRSEIIKLILLFTSVISSIIAYVVLHNNLYGDIILLTGFISIIMFDLLIIFEKRKLGRKAKLSLPVIYPIVYALMSYFSIYSSIFAVISAFFIEDLVLIRTLSSTTIAKVKKVVGDLIFAFTLRESLFLLSLSLIPGVISYAISSSILSFVPTMIAIGLIIYSSITFKVRREREGLSFFERLMSTVPVIVDLVSSFYSRESIRNRVREAGMKDEEFINLMYKVSILFTIFFLVTLDVSPLVLLLSHTLFLSLWVIPMIIYIIPLIIINSKRSARISRIRSSILLILLYLSVLSAVGRQFREMIETAIKKPDLGRTFGLEIEARIFRSIPEKEEFKAMKKYASSIPDPMFKDTLLSYIDSYNIAGPLGGYRAIANKLTDIINTILVTTRQRISNYASIIPTISIMAPLISVVLIMGDMIMIPFVYTAISIVTAMFAVVLVKMLLPSLKSEYNVKDRLKYTSLVIPVLFTIELIVLRVFLPSDLALYTTLSSIPALIGLAIYLSVKNQIKTNKIFMDKFDELFGYFYSTFSSTHDVRNSIKSLLGREISLPKQIKRELEKIYNIVRTQKVENISFHGPFWVKLFRFIVYASGLYGYIPKDVRENLNRLTTGLKVVIKEVEGLVMPFIINIVIGIALFGPLMSFPIFMATNPMMKSFEKIGGEYKKTVQEMGLVMESDVIYKTIEYMLLLLPLANSLLGIVLGYMKTGSKYGLHYMYVMWVLTVASLLISFNISIVKGFPTVFKFIQMYKGGG